MDVGEPGAVVRGGGSGYVGGDVGGGAYGDMTAGDGRGGMLLDCLVLICREMSLENCAVLGERVAPPLRLPALLAL
jgi:hypothetical protein